MLLETTGVPVVKFVSKRSLKSRLAETSSLNWRLNPFTRERWRLPSFTVALSRTGGAFKRTEMEIVSEAVRAGTLLSLTMTFTL